ncbi:DUF4294 domain-containing protein [Flavobacterium cellulosilyticum]|uniref:DUF4294 domain-containing protein n=1 Tax=Flavobacterium cellulosilyticum TaxID=2541731 RepID=A0A4R5C418_9FLAO|nr:DUF4294 domain-containing protein [Flavobacterium cellulosilyticum]TDD93685.1 DUF4294 domain-containing protein [Flavobacterium cellulosilyticum]
MKIVRFLFFFLLLSISIQAQVLNKVTLKKEITETEIDSVFNDTIALEEIVISKVKLDTESLKQFTILRNRVYVTYPYAKLASERLTALNRGMNSLKTNKEKKKYFKIIEDYLSNEFEERLKKLSRKQGQILVKLIHRQTGTTTYDLVKSLKSGWKAFWSNTAARMFDLNLKEEYQPYQSNEDYLIETILVRAFESGRLINQPPAKPVNYDDLTDYWVSKASKENK